MLPATEKSQAEDTESLRFATTDSFDQFFTSAETKAIAVTREQALEEAFFLGLRLNRGVSLRELGRKFVKEAQKYAPLLEELIKCDLLILADDTVRLTPRGRLLSNEVFQKFIGAEEPTVRA